MPRVWPIPVALFRHQIIITLATPLPAALLKWWLTSNSVLERLAAAQHRPGDAGSLVGHGVAELLPI
jgi:hypothetical protein